MVSCELLLVLNVWLPAKLVEINATELTEDEAELYDRQIRLWGLDSQKSALTCIICMYIICRS